MAKVKKGDCILITDGELKGRLAKVIITYDNGGISAEVIGDDVPYYPYLFSGEYRKLEKESATKSIEDLLAGLAQTVAKLQRQVTALAEQSDSNTKYIRTISEEVAGLSGDVEMLIDDVVTLDERMADAELDTNFTVKEGIDVAKLAAEIARTTEKEIAKVDGRI